MSQDQSYPGKPRAAHKGASRRLRSLRRGFSEHPPAAPKTEERHVGRVLGYLGTLIAAGLE